jgi:membrane protease YdiL (CAAX protease family)
MVQARRRRLPVRKLVGLACGLILLFAGLLHVSNNLSGGHPTRTGLLLVYVGLIGGMALMGAAVSRHAWQRWLYIIGAVAVFGSLTAVQATSDPSVQDVERGILLAILLGFSVSWATRPLRGTIQGGLRAAQFGVGLFIADQLAAYGIGGAILIARPELQLRAWPLAVVGELVQESCLILIVGVCLLASPSLIDGSRLRLPRGWKSLRSIVIVALQVEFAVIAFQLVLQLVLRFLHVDVDTIGNATFPGPSDWQPALPLAVLLLAVLPGVAEELVFRGAIFGVARNTIPVVAATVLAAGLFGLGHLSPDMTPANNVAVFLNVTVFGLLAAVAYLRTHSLYAPILAHVLNDTGPALAVALPHEMMHWVFFGLVELSVIGMLPVLFALMRRHRQRWGGLLTNGPGASPSAPS